MNNYQTRVYVAGALSANNVLDVHKHCGRMEKLSTEVFKAGFSPFCPASDRLFIIHDPEFEFTVEMFYEYSLAWLRVSDCLLLVPGFKYSTGTLKEIEEAHKLKIPVFETLEELKEYYRPH